MNQTLQSFHTAIACDRVRIASALSNFPSKNLNSSEVISTNITLPNESQMNFRNAPNLIYDSKSANTGRYWEPSLPTDEKGPGDIWQLKNHKKYMSLIAKHPFKQSLTRSVSIN